MVKFSPQFLHVIDETARKVFGNLPVVPYRTGNKLLKQKPLGPIWAAYYPKDMTRDFRNVIPTFRTELEEIRDEKRIYNKANNKGPPKKGQGKRATRK
jgi:small subunit ribosomal protein S33